jgi:spore germination cell wall hydrolase CwlJ-like protein
MKKLLLYLSIGIVLLVSGSHHINKSTLTLHQAMSEYRTHLEHILHSEHEREKKLLAYKRKQIICLAKNIYREARGQSRKEQLAVALVTINRVKHHFASSVCGVVYEPGQFSWVGHPRPSFEPWQWHIAKYLARLVYTTHVHDFTKGALYFYAADDPNPPTWASDYQETIQVGNQIFYRP